MRSTGSRAYPAWIGIVLVFYTFIAIGITEGGLGVLLPSILQTYTLTPATVTLLFLSQVSGYVIAALTSSLLSSRFGLARMLLLATTMLTSALCIYALTTHWWVMVAAGTLSGLGCGLIDAGGNTYIASDQRNANLMGMLHAFYGIGALLGPTIATTLLAFAVTWQQIYGVIASVVSVTIVGVLWAVIHRYPPMTRRAIAAETDAKTSLSVALKTPAVLVSGLLLLIYVGTEVSIGNWAYTVQTISRGIPHWIAGYSLSGYWLGLTAGRLGMGQMVKYWGAIRTINFSLTLLMAGLLSWWLLPNVWVTLPVIGFALSAIFPAMIWLTPKRVPAAIVPAAIGFLASVGSLGSAVIPALLGQIADRAGLEIIPILLLPIAASMVILHRWLVQHVSLQPDLSS
jgi:fucose permease